MVARNLGYHSKKSNHHKPPKIMYYIDNEIVELYEGLDREDKLFVVTGLIKYIGNNQRVADEKIRAKRPVYSLADKESYERKFKELHNQLNHVLI
jgi:hypothetical protein